MSFEKEAPSLSPQKKLGSERVSNPGSCTGQKGMDVSAHVGDTKAEFCDTEFCDSISKRQSRVLGVSSSSEGAELDVRKSFDRG